MYIQLTKPPSRTQHIQQKLGEIIGKTATGGRLPSEPVLAKQLGVSRSTLREAMRTFETQGLIRRRQGSGTYVTNHSQTIESGLEILESIETMAERIGLDVRMVGKKVMERPATKNEADSLNIEIGSNVINLARVMQAENRPVAYLIDIISSKFMDPDQLIDDFTGSVVDYIKMLGEPILSSSRCEITAVSATPDIARMMEIQRGDVLLKFVSYLYSDKGEVVDYSFSYFLPGYFRFHVIRKLN